MKKKIKRTCYDKFKCLDHAKRTLFAGSIVSKLRIMTMSRENEVTLIKYNFAKLQHANLHDKLQSVQLIQMSSSIQNNWSCTYRAGGIIGKHKQKWEAQKLSRSVEVEHI